MKLSRFATFAWGVLAYNLAVILWGAYVRASGSGAGCGSHWPLCGGEVVPRAPRIETLIEFSHRLSSGLALVLAIVMLVWAWRAFPRGHRLRLGAGLAMLFIITEALVGAGLVLFGLTDKNDSAARAISLAVHLLNTFLLLAALTLTAWWASGGRPVRLRGQGALVAVFVVGLLGAMVVGATGAVTALGDTLFPAGSLAEGLRQDFSPAAHFLLQLRIIHPILAVIVGAYAIFAGAFGASRRPGPATRWLARALVAIFLAQIAVGVANVALLAPVSMQLIHLLMADAVWITLVLAATAALTDPATAREPLPVPEPALRPR
ncbi:MAG TPA: COX15/CtaA family protein [Roseiflexaceae bacterium]